MYKLLDPLSAIDDRPVNAITLVVGLGSSHGDDQIGWRVAERLAASIADKSDRSMRCSTADVSIRIARSPSELLGWFDGIERLFVCDAGQNIGTAGATLRLRWPNNQLATLGCSGSHDMGLTEVLALAEQLCRLPKEVIIWCAQVDSTMPGSSLSASGCAAVSRLVGEIGQELSVIARAAK